MERQKVGLVHGAPQLFTWERVRKSPAILGGLGGHPQRLFGYFLCVQKVTAGRGGAEPPYIREKAGSLHDCKVPAFFVR